MSISPATHFPLWKTSTRGLVGNKIRDVTATGAADTMEIAIEDLGQWSIGPDQSLKYPREIEPTLLTEALCGPILPLALAQRKVYCLHGSAFLRQDQLTLLLGASGAGKSTLVKALLAHGFDIWADDTVAVCNDEKDQSPGQSPGHYPQPKWTSWQAKTTQKTATISQIICLQPEPGVEPTVSALTPTQATLALVQHTVAGRLFSPAILREHLQFSAALARQIPCWTLHYHQTPSNLPKMVGLVSALKDST